MPSVYRGVLLYTTIPSKKFTTNKILIGKQI